MGHVLQPAVVFPDSSSLPTVAGFRIAGEVGVRLDSDRSLLVLGLEVGFKGLGDWNM